MKKRLLTLVMALITAISLTNVAFADDPTPTLIVDGVDVLETSTYSGSGWDYDPDTLTITLDGYNGGPITAERMELTVQLAPNSTNVVTTSEKTAIGASACKHLKMIGAEDATIDITANENAILGLDVTIQDCTITAKSLKTSAPPASAIDVACIDARGATIINNSNITISQCSVGIAGFNTTTIEDSDITVSNSVFGIHAQMNNLILRNCNIDINGSTAALYNIEGGVIIDNVEGSISATTAAIYAQNNKGTFNVSISNSNLDINAANGIMSYAPVIIDESTLDLNDCPRGVYAYSTSYSSDVTVNGESTILADECTSVGLLVYGDYNGNPNDNVNAIVQSVPSSAAAKDASLQKIYLCGDIVDLKSTYGTRNVIIPEGDTLTITENASIDFTKNASITVDGTLINNGTLKINGAKTTNNGTIENYGALTLADDTQINGNPALTPSEEAEVVFEQIDEGDGYIVYQIGLKTKTETELYSVTSGQMMFEVTQPANGRVGIEVAGDNDFAVSGNDTAGYLFYLDNDASDAIVRAKKGETVAIGTLTVSGYATEADPATIKAHTAQAEYKNATDSLKKDIIVDDGILTYVKNPTTKNLTINVKFLNTVEDNDTAYQDMTVTITGSDLALPIVKKLGADEIAITPATATEPAAYVVEIEDTLRKSYTYTVTVTGAGYRAARCTVTMTDDKELTFWNNVMDDATYIENGVGIPVKTNFLAGDIVKDNNINIYDLSAVVSYFGKIIDDTSVASDFAKYDLNRDGKIDSKDVAYVLVSWNY